MLSQELDESGGNHILCVKNQAELEWNPEVDVSRGGHVAADVLKEEVWFCEVEAIQVERSFVYAEVRIREALYIYY
jgi:hypothetical protein